MAESGEPNSVALEDVDKAVAKGAAWMVGARLVDRSLGIISLMILARLLLPADFGLVAMATSITSLLELFSQFGFDMVLIQNQRAMRRHYDTAWTFSVIVYSCMAVALVAVAVPGARYYREPRLVPVVVLLALGTFCQGLENVGIVLFRKELTFHKDFSLTFWRRIMSFAVTIPLAVVLRDYRALVAGVLAGRLAGVWLSYRMQPYRPRFSLAARHEIFHFSKWMFINNILSFVGTRSGDFIIGRTGGARMLGLFNMSFEVSTLPTSELIAPINRAVYPGYARKASDNQGLKQSYLDVMGLVASAGLPAALGISAIADLLVRVFLGERWNDAAPLVTLLALFGILTTLMANTHYVYLAIGRPQVPAVLGTIQTAVLIPALLWLTPKWGALGAAYAFLVSQVVFTPISYAVFRRVVGVTLAELGGVFGRPLVAALAMWGTVRVLRGVLASVGGGVPAPVLLAGCVALGALTYAACLFALWRRAGSPVGAERRLLNLFRSEIVKYLRRSARAETGVLDNDEAGKTGKPSSEHDKADHRSGERKSTDRS